VHFNKAFTPEIDVYIKETQDNKKTPTVKGFAQRIGTDVFSLWQWANKKKKNEQGELTDELARPNFHQALTKLEQLEKELSKKLTDKQELFCKLYATNRDYFGNGTQAYAEAYGIDISKPGNYRSASSSAYNLLINPDILKRIDELLELGPLNNQYVDRQLAFVMEQNADLSSKVAAIREYNKLRARITDKMDVTSKGKQIEYTPLLGGKTKDALPTNDSTS
jgi:hypothetical protein